MWDRIRHTVKARILVLGLILGGWAVLPAPPALGQSKTGTTVGQFLLIEPSARIAAMGNAGVSLYDGIQSIYYNPAALAGIKRPTVQFTHSSWLADIGYEYAAGAFSIGNWGNLFAGVTSLNSKEIEVRTVEQPLGTGERYTVSDLALSLGLGREFTDRFAAGLQVNYFQESIWHSTLSTTTLSMGTLYRLSPGGLALGASISNFGTRAQFSGRDLAIQYDNDPSRNGDNSALPGERSTDEFPVPVLFRIGLSTPYQITPQQRLRVAVDAFHPNSNTESLSGGAEWTWKDLLSLRGGYQTLFQKDSEAGLTLGAGLQGHWGRGRYHFDYAWADQGRLQETHRFTFVLSF